MNIQPKEMLIYSMVALTLAVVVNNVAELDIPFLNKIERAIIPPSERGLKSGKKHFDYSNTENSAFDISPECKRIKTRGDAKTILRSKIREAKRAKDTYLTRELEEQLAEIEDAERQACN